MGTGGSNGSPSARRRQGHRRVGGRGRHHHRSRAVTDPATRAGEGEVEVFATGTTWSTSFEPEPVSETVTTAVPIEGTTISRPVATVDVPPPASADEAPRSYRVGPRLRPGAEPTLVATRSAGGAEVLRPLLLDPRLAGELARSGRLFDDPIPHLRLTNGPVPDDLSAWRVEIVGLRRRRVPARLGLWGTPSLAVTVLELVPARRLRVAQRPFLKHAISAVDELADRILAAARSTGSDGAAPIA